MDRSKVSQTPGHTKARGPMGWRATVRRTLVPILAASAIGLVFACGGGPDGTSSRGRNLEIHALTPTLADRVTLADAGGQFRVLRPTASNKRLAVVNITVVNRTTTVIPLLVDGEAARLGDRRGQRINALNPFEGGVLVVSADPEETVYSPMLWGQLELERNTQVTGWILFEVPKGMTLGTIWWDEVDPIVADFIDYRRK